MGLTASYVCTRNFWENPLFALFLAFLGKFLMIFKKISCHHFSFFAETIPGLECFLRLHQVTCHYFRVGEYNVATKKQTGAKKAIWKKRFFRFYAEITADTGFQSAALEQRKIQPVTKGQNFSKCIIALFATSLQVSDACQKIFLIIGITFFILITSASNLVGFCRTQMWKCTSTFRFFVFGTGGVIFYMWKMTKTPLKNQLIYFCTSQKICTILV